MSGQRKDRNGRWSLAAACGLFGLLVVTTATAQSIAQSPGQSAAEDDTPAWRQAGDEAAATLRAEGAAAALPQFQRALQIARAAEDPIGVAYVQVWLGQVHGRRGDYASATASADEAIAVYRRLEQTTGEPQRGLPSALGTRAIIARRTGDFETARDLLNEQLGLIADAPPERQAPPWNNLGSIYYDLGDLRGAERAYRRSAELRREAGDRFGEAVPLGNLSNVQESLGDFDGARASLERSIELRRQSQQLGEGLIVALRNLATLEKTQHNTDRARELIGEALRLSEKTAEHSATPALLAASAEIEAASGNLGDAATLAERALRFAEQLDDPRSALIAQLILSQALFEAGRRPQGLAAAQGARRRAEEFGLRPHLWKAIELEGRGTEDPRRARERFHEAIDELENWRDERVPQGTARRRFLDQRRTPYHRLVELEVAQERAWAALLAADRARARTLVDLLGEQRNDATVLPPSSPPADLAELRRRLDGRSLLAYTATSKGLWIASIDVHGQLRWTRREPAQRDLRRDVAKLVTALAERAPGWRAEAQRLGTLLAPDDWEPGSKGVLIVPDDALWRVPWPALEGPRGSWLDGPPLLLAPSLAVFARRAEADRAADPTRWLWSGRRPWAARAGIESTELRSLDDPTWERLESADVVHFAGHGELVSGAPLRSTIVLSLDRDSAGDSSTPRLIASDLLERQLRSQVMVFAACSTGSDPIGAGEGMAGFSWTTLSRGARNVVTSLWAVDDDATTGLERTFYERLLVPSAGDNEVSLAFALQRAMRTTRAAEGTEHPFHWAAWQLIGDGVFRGPERTDGGVGPK